MEKPILFSDPMVKAILEGRKTQTRRVVKPQPESKPFQVHGEKTGDWFTSNPDYPKHGDMMSGRWKCPYGQPGDLLWVRETWSVNFYGGGSVDGGVQQHYGVEYKADLGVKNIHLDHYDKNLSKLFDTQRGEWRPSIHMPRWASRITLEVVGVRVERLQDINDADARSEGVDWASPQPYGEKLDWDDCEDPREVGYPPPGASFALDNFRRLWDSINRKKHPWDSNPWVWVIEFKKSA